MAFKPIDTRQIANRSALPHIGSAANDTLDDILSKIDAIIGSSGGGSTSSWLAGNVAIASGSNTVSYTFTHTLPDTSYVLLLTMQNTVDVNPQFLQPLNVTKTINGFTVELNAPTDSVNYSINYIVPTKTIPTAEFSVSSGSNTITVPFGIPNNGSNYGIIAILQDLVDPNPQFQSLTITTQNATEIIASLNSTTDSNNYQLVYVQTGTAVIPLGNDINSVTFNVPVAYGNTNYALVASISNLVDLDPQFSVPLITSKSGSAVTIKLNQNTDSSNYKLTYYALSFA